MPWRHRRLLDAEEVDVRPRFVLARRLRNESYHDRHHPIGCHRPSEFLTSNRNENASVNVLGSLVTPYAAEGPAAPRVVTRLPIRGPACALATADPSRDGLELGRCARYKAPVRTARDYAADALLRVERGHGWVHDHLAAARPHVRDPRDRALMTELAYGVMRRRATLDAIIGRVSKRRVRDLHAAVKTALRMGAYQLVFLDAIPAHAALDHAAGWAKHHAGAKRAGYVNACMRALLPIAPIRRNKTTDPPPSTHAVDERRDIPRGNGTMIRLERRVFPSAERGVVPNLAARYSCPAWLVSRWLKALGRTRCEAHLLAGLTTPPLTFRARTDADSVLTRAAALDVELAPGSIDGSWRVVGRVGRAMDLVGEGLLSVQDETSQRAAPLLALQGGETVLDLCAAPGGKTLQIFDLLGRGAVTATDVQADKVEELDALTPPSNDISYTTALVASAGALPFARESFDAILVDAPCSNTGVLRRRVEARWRLRPSDWVSLADTQRSLLVRAWPLLKPGGRMVYSTCSIESHENEHVVQHFVAEHENAAPGNGYRMDATFEADGGFGVPIDKRI